MLFLNPVSESLQIMFTVSNILAILIFHIRCFKSAIDLPWLKKVGNSTFAWPKHLGAKPLEDCVKIGGTSFSVKISHTCTDLPST